MAKVSIRGILGALFLVMAFLQSAGFLLMFFRFGQVRVFNLGLVLVYLAVAALLLRKK